MATPEEIPDALRNLSGLKILGRIRSLFAHLYDQQCQRNKAGNRTLHFDQLVALVMLAMFNPVARSLRALSQVGDLKHVRKRFGVNHSSLGSLSEATRLLDPEALTDVIAELTAQKNPLTAVDGTLLKALPTMVESAWLDTRDGRTRHAWRLHLHFDVDRSIPSRVDLTRPSNSGEAELAAMRHCVTRGRPYGSVPGPRARPRCWGWSRAAAPGGGPGKPSTLSQQSRRSRMALS